MTESLTLKVLPGLLTAYPVVTLEHEERISIHAEQCVVVRLIKKARAVDPRKRALFLRADVDQLERRTALDQGLQLRRKQLANWGVRDGGLAQGWL